MSLDNIDWTKFYELLKSGTKEEFNTFIEKHELIIKDGKVFPKNATRASELIEYWDKQQHVKKINLNSLYGALLNKGSRFNDKRIGQSVTLCGRQIVKHMTAKTNELITGEYNCLGKSIVYGDTDSCYFSAYPVLEEEINSNIIPWDKDNVVKLYDQICELVNQSFVQFMNDSFNCPSERGDVIRAGREIVGINSLFVTKKRYAVLYYDKEGKRKEDIKAMGLDLKRSDTPEFVQDFLMDILKKVLTDIDKDVILKDIQDFRKKFREMPAWEKGTPKRVNNLTKFRLMEEQRKSNLPGHVRASLNWNTLKHINNDNYSSSILDGSKIIVCPLRMTPLGFTSVAYPIDELRLPDWFKELPFDHDEMEETLINNKLKNLIGVLNWPIDDLEQTAFNTLFELE